MGVYHLSSSSTDWSVRLLVFAARSRIASPIAAGIPNPPTIDAAADLKFETKAPVIAGSADARQKHT